MSTTTNNKGYCFPVCLTLRIQRPNPGILEPLYAVSLIPECFIDGRDDSLLTCLRGITFTCAPYRF